jgi:two-component system sensor histidine kinase PilS (NtrC family)
MAEMAKNEWGLNPGSLVGDPEARALSGFGGRSTSVMPPTRTMSPAPDLRTWLPWVIKIRFVIVTLIFAIEYGLAQIVPDPGHWVSIKHLGVVAVLWYVLGLFFLIYNQLGRDYLLQAYLQIFSDILVITALVHFTGDLDSNYFSLYLVTIILASVLLPRPRAFLVAAVCFVCMGIMLELAYLPSLYPQFVRRYLALDFLASSSLAPADTGTLEVKILASLLGFFAVTYLSTHLAESLRKTGAELRHKTGQVASLYAIKENIIQSMRGGLITTDLSGAVQEVNPAGCAILGYKSEELTGRSILELLTALREDGESAFDPSAPYTRREIVYQRPGGEHRTLGVSASALQVPEIGVAGYVYTFQDLTEEKHREAEYRAKDRMATLGRLAAGIAHEIRNPLASIAGSIKLLPTVANLNEDQSKLVDIVSRESARLDKLVSDFLVYAREQRCEFRPADLVNLVEETLLLLEHHPLLARGCRVERRLPRQPVMASVDPDKIRQVFWNICDNALKAMPDGGTLTAELDDANPEVARISFEDTGPGLAPQQLEKIFEPFVPGFSNGTGLGLAIVHQIVQGHHGRIRVHSRPGKGAKFLVELPRAQKVAKSDSEGAKSRSRWVGRGEDGDGL